MKFSEVKLNPDHQYVHYSRQGLPQLIDAVMIDFEDVDKTIIKLTDGDIELRPEQEKQVRAAKSNYYLFFFYGVYKALQAGSAINEAWRSAQMAEGENKLKQVGKVLR